MTDPVTENMVDVAFRLHGGRVPVDHAFALSRAVCATLPWFDTEPAARLHLLHTADSGSGWLRPDDTPGAELHLSKRTKLRLRVPGRRADDAMALCGRPMELHGQSLTPGPAAVLSLAPADTLFARHVVCGPGEDESRFVQRLTETLRESGIRSGRLLCGRAHRLSTPDAVVHTRSLVVTRLDPESATSLLRNGVGPCGKLGCGVFIPYKTIE